MRTRPVSAAQVRAYAGKAQEYADAASSEVESKRYIAATSLAIHAAINTADAACGARLGKCAAGEDYDQVLTLLKQAGPDGASVEKELRRLLPLKTKAEERIMRDLDAPLPARFARYAARVRSFKTAGTACSSGPR